MTVKGSLAVYIGMLDTGSKRLWRHGRFGKASAGPGTGQALDQAPQGLGTAPSLPEFKQPLDNALRRTV